MNIPHLVDQFTNRPSIKPGFQIFYRLHLLYLNIFNIRRRDLCGKPNHQQPPMLPEMAMACLNPPELINRLFCGRIIEQNREIPGKHVCLMTPEGKHNWIQNVDEAFW